MARIGFAVACLASFLACAQAGDVFLHQPKESTYYDAAAGQYDATAAAVALERPSGVEAKAVQAPVLKEKIYPSPENDLQEVKAPVLKEKAVADHFAGAGSSSDTLKSGLASAQAKYSEAKDDAASAAKAIAAAKAVTKHAMEAAAKAQAEAEKKAKAAVEAKAEARAVEEARQSALAKAEAAHEAEQATRVAATQKAAREKKVEATKAAAVAKTAHEKLAREEAKTKSVANEAELAAQKAKDLEASVKTLFDSKDKAAADIAQAVSESELKTTAAKAAKDQADKAFVHVEAQFLKKSTLEAKLKAVDAKTKLTKEAVETAHAAATAAAADLEALSAATKVAKADLQKREGEVKQRQTLTTEYTLQASAAVAAREIAVKASSSAAKALMDAQAAVTFDTEQLKKRKAQLADIVNHPV